MLARPFAAALFLRACSLGAHLSPHAVPSPACPSLARRHIPLAGRDISTFIQKCLRDRGEPVPPEDSLEVAKRIKEQFCYVSQDVSALRAVPACAPRATV